MPTTEGERAAGSRRAGALRFGIIGDLVVEVPGSGVPSIPLGGERQRALLARLLLAAGEPVPRETLVEDVFAQAATGAKALQVAISRLRAVLPPERLITVAGGYRLRVEAGELDADRFAGLIADAHAASAREDPRAALAALSAARALWRGPVLGGIGGAIWAAAEVSRLDELRVTGDELRCEAELALGHRADALAMLRRLVAEHPERERLRGTLMLALYQDGRQVEALELFHEGRRRLVDTLGIEPGLALRELHQAILSQDPRLRSPAPGVEMPGPARLAAHRDRTFVGRGAELQALGAALERCAAGNRVVAFVSGEAGIGKTQLVAELAARAAASGFTVLAGRCLERSRHPFDPLADALEEGAGRFPEGALAANAAEHGPWLRRLVPALAAAEVGGGLPEPSEGETIAGAPQYGVFTALTDLLARGSATAPLLLVLEDLHWAQPAALLALEHLLSVPTRPRVMVLATFRAESALPPLLERLAGELHREPVNVRVELGGLPEPELRELMQRLGHREELRSDAAARLRRVSGGNPLFVCELVRSLDATPGLPLSRALTEGASSIELPSSVRETISRRLGRLDLLTYDTLGAAAVLGVDFDARLVPAVAGGDPSAVADALSRARAGGLLDGTGQNTSFRHALIAQTLIDLIEPGELAGLHRRAAEAIEALPTAARHASELARHWSEAGDAEALDRALEWSRRAGEEALARFAPQRAQRHYEQALGLLDARGDADGPERCELLISLGEAQRHAGDARFRQTLLDAARMAHRAGDERRLVRAALGNTRGFASAIGEPDREVNAVLELALGALGDARSAERARLLANFAGELSFDANREQARRLSDEALAIARELGDPGALVHVLSSRNIAIWSPETLAERLANTEECRHAADLLGDPTAQFLALHWRASACVGAGRFAEAKACRARARGVAERLRQPTTLWMSAYDEADELIVAGALEAAERQAMRGLELGQASGQPDAALLFASELIVLRHDQGRLHELTELIAQTLDANPALTGYRSVLALARCEGGEYEEAARLLALDAVDGFSGLPVDLTWLSVACTYAHIAARLYPRGLTDRATLTTLREMLAPWSDQVAWIGPAGGRIVAHHLGVAEAALGDHAAAREHLEAATRLAELAPAPVWAARARCELARCRLAEGAAEEARGLLMTTIAQASDLGAAGVRADAEALLEQIA